jgi:hypothetical protein
VGAEAALRAELAAAGAGGEGVAHGNSRGGGQCCGRFWLKKKRLKEENGNRVVYVFTQIHLLPHPNEFMQTLPHHPWSHRFID